MFQRNPIVYYAGYDPGSGEATLAIVPEDNVHQLAVHTIPSVIAEVLGLLKATERNERLGRLREADVSRPDTVQRPWIWI